MAGPVSTTAELLAATNDVTTSQDGSKGFASSVMYQILGTWVGTVTFEGTVNGSDWASIGATKMIDAVVAPTTLANGIFRVPSHGMLTRVKFTSRTSGTVEVYREPTIG